MPIPLQPTSATAILSFCENRAVFFANANGDTAAPATSDPEYFRKALLDVIGLLQFLSFNI
jgi:hypothetical protein